MYTILRPIVRFSLDQFFSRITVAGAPQLERGPLIVVANHPNFLLDSLCVVSLYKRQLWFLAKSTLFSTPIAGALLRLLHLLPVYRRQDNPEEMARNRETFSACCAQLKNGNALAVFPEGVSLGERKIAPIKTGAVRIAFQAEEESDFKLGVQIQPVGITYGSLTLFRSSVTLVVGDPIPLKDWRDRYRADAQEAVRALTAEIEERLRTITVEVGESAHTELVEQISDLYRAAGRGADDFERMKIIASNVEQVAKNPPPGYDDIRDRLDTYVELQSALLTHDRPLAENKILRGMTIGLVLWGILSHYIPYRITGDVTRARATHPVYTASFKFAYGILFFGVWYLGWSVLAWILSGSFLVALVSLLLFAAGGYAANNHLSGALLVVLSALWPGSRSPEEMLSMIRDELVESLDSLRVV